MVETYQNVSENVNLSENGAVMRLKYIFFMQSVVHTAKIDAKLPTMRKVEANDSDTSVECHQNSSNRSISISMIAACIRTSYYDA